MSSSLSSNIFSYDYLMSTDHAKKRTLYVLACKSAQYILPYIDLSKKQTNTLSILSILSTLSILNSSTTQLDSDKWIDKNVVTEIHLDILDDNDTLLD
ncbi:7654_t:CDS:2 [Funneliformis caledonium]|uniref:7654_t:CDS:1 n=1 Tax=Funneliformis caledonium TaxID=1117310 RepID=A0A9N9AGT0_9GLOM|nr:7654_t:CDS:2 [Funneliformis caledonium]